MDHMPINRHMSGSFDGNTRLKERTPPNSIEAYAWTSKTVYKVLPGTAGFLEAVEALGAKVAAALLTTWFTEYIIMTRLLQHSKYTQDGAIVCLSDKEMI